MDFEVVRTGTGEDDWKVVASPSAGLISAVGYVTQTLREMQEDMDDLQGELFEEKQPAVKAPPTDFERCVEFRTNYHSDMDGLYDEFERFEESFTFKKPYTSEDPLDLFLLPPSATALEAFKRF